MGQQFKCEGGGVPSGWYMCFVHHPYEIFHFGLP